MSWGKSSKHGTLERSLSLSVQSLALPSFSFLGLVLYVVKSEAKTLLVRESEIQEDQTIRRRLLCKHPCLCLLLMNKEIPIEPCTLLRQRKEMLDHFFIPIG